MYNGSKVVKCLLLFRQGMMKDINIYLYIGALRNIYIENLFDL